jgi:predicted RNase H-like HicB family nuclease
MLATSGAAALVLAISGNSPPVWRVGDSSAGQGVQVAESGGLTVFVGAASSCQLRFVNQLGEGLVVVEPIPVVLQDVGELGWEAELRELGVHEFGDTPEECLAAVVEGLAFAFTAYAEEAAERLDPEALRVAENLRRHLRVDRAAARA